MHEVPIRKCGRITHTLCWVAMEIVQLLTYEGFPYFPKFIGNFEDQDAEPQRLLALEEGLKATPTC